MMQILQEEKLLYNAKLDLLTDIIIDYLPDVFTTLSIDFHELNNYYHFSCPIHCGNNRNALQMYGRRGKYPGRWRCVTQGCQSKYKSNPLGFIRGVLTSRNHKTFSFWDSVNWALGFLKTDWGSLKPDLVELEKKRFASQNVIIENKTGLSIPRYLIKQNYSYPPPILLERKFSPHLLRSYDVSECNNKSKKCYQRLIVPIYDRSGQFMVGYSARSIFPECPICEYYHPAESQCPSSDYERWKGQKWHHSPNFPASDNLYNLWESEKFIRKTKTVILTEGPLDALKLVQHAIFNVVSIYGTDLKGGQAAILDNMGVLSIIALLDNDEAGQSGAKRLVEKYGKFYRIFFPKISAKDPGEMNGDQITNDILPYLESVT